ncbi:MAG: hypothetical protein LC775_18025, partial [Acidobacteria bacterium]|nr:hypothetical protein [Acidobacteriota bacterium]
AHPTSIPESCTPPGGRLQRESAPPPRFPRDLYRVKADTTGSRRSSRAALCRLSCWFVSSGANARWAQVGGALRKYSAHVGAEAPAAPSRILLASRAAAHPGDSEYEDVGVGNTLPGYRQHVSLVGGEGEQCSDHGWATDCWL